MRVLVACEFSGIVRDAFIAKGHDAWSCDLLPPERPGPHIQDDVLKHLDEGWDIMIAHPPCTYLANSGLQHLHKDNTRWERLKEGRDFFLKLWLCDIPRVAVENPVPHKYAALPAYCQIIHPWLFGERVMKKTCLWLRGLPPLFATGWMVDHGERYFRKDRGKLRSITSKGIAQAMADQWGTLNDPTPKREIVGAVSV